MFLQFQSKEQREATGEEARERTREEAEGSIAEDSNTEYGER